MIKVKHLNKAFGSIPVLRDLNLTVNGPLVLMGPSGRGKTTLLRILMGLETPDSGTVQGVGNIGAVFQENRLCPQLTAVGNICLVGGVNPAQAQAELQTLGFTQAELALPVARLSGGQQRRTALLRALLCQPVQTLLLDEPFAAIDAKVRQELRSWLKEMISKLGVTSIFVTHDQDEAIEVADEIIITNRGHIEQMGTPIEIYRHPQTAFTASFFGQTSVLADYQKYHTFQRMDGVEKAIVRPEFLKITRKNEVQKYGSSASKGVVERTSFRGDWIELAVRVHGDLLIAKRDLEEEPITVGETVDVFLYRLFVIAGEKCYLLENQSLQDDSVFI